MPAAEWKTGLPQRKEIVVGEVKPFAVSSVAAESNRIAGRRIILQFSKPLAEEVSPETVSRWISVTPAPEKLKAEVEGDTVTLKGEFALGPKYRVAVKPGIPARQPFQLEKAQTKEVVFKQIAPRLYFEDFATHQHRAGTRKFRLLSVNIPRIRVTARLFTGDTTPVAIKAYDKYQEFDGGNGGRRNVHAASMSRNLPGQIIWDRELKTSTGVDQPETLPLNWDEILGEHKSGTVLLTAESIDPTTPGGNRVGTQAVVQLTDIGSVWKRDRSGISLHLFSITTGQALPGVQLRLLDTEQKLQGEAVTDANGGAHLPDVSESRWIFAQSEGDAHLIAIYNGEASVPLYRLGVTDDSGEGEIERSVFLFTERGVYKPGDIVYLKGIARNLNENQATLPAGKKLTLKVNDARGREILSKEVTLSEFGSFAEEIKVPAGTLGKYRVSVGVEEKENLTGYCDFQVQEYRPNAFEISIPAPPAATGPLTLDLADRREILHGQTALESEAHLVARGARRAVQAGGARRFRVQLTRSKIFG